MSVVCTTRVDITSWSALMRAVCTIRVDITSWSALDLMLSFQLRVLDDVTCFFTMDFFIVISIVNQLLFISFEIGPCTEIANMLKYVVWLVFYWEMLEHLLVFSCNGIDVIKKLHLCPFGWHRCNFLIKKITTMPLQENTRRCSSIHLFYSYE
jgi:hypothetical protein